MSIASSCGPCAAPAEEVAEKLDLLADEEPVGKPASKKTLPMSEDSNQSLVQSVASLSRQLEQLQESYRFERAQADSRKMLVTKKQADSAVSRDDVHTVAQRLLVSMCFGRAGGEVPSMKAAKKDVQIAYALAEAFCEERDRQIREA